MPYRLALFTGWMLAWLGHFVLKYRVATARERIREVFGDGIVEDEIRRIAWISWRTFIFGAIDMFRLRRIDMEWIKRHVIDWEKSRDRIHAAHSRGLGALLACPHLGSMELSPVVFQRLGLPVFIMQAPQKNPLTDDFIERTRGSTGIPVVQRGSAQVRSMINRLRQGEAVVIPSDLRVLQNGVFIQFLGKEASVAPGISLFSNRTQVPIIPFIAVRVGWTRHRFEVYDPVVSDPEKEKGEDQRHLTQEVFRVFEEAIREFPEQWFWYNKSWILEQVEDRTEGNGDR